MLCLNARQKNNTVRIARNADVSLGTDYHNATVGQAGGEGELELSGDDWDWKSVAVCNRHLES